MKLSAPKSTVLLISLILAALGIAGQFVAIPFISDHSFWFTAAGYALLLLGNILKGL